MHDVRFARRLLPLRWHPNALRPIHEAEIGGSTERRDFDQSRPKHRNKDQRSECKALRLYCSCHCG